MTFFFSQNSKRRHLSILLAFVFSLLYWIYLAFNTQISIRYDSVGYEKLASTIAHEGFQKYFETGPNREPIYPWLLSRSFLLSEKWQVPYLDIQKGIQILILLATQAIIFLILKRLRVSPGLTAGALFYFGISPAIVNSLFSVYSEIMTYPVILGIIVMAAWGWTSIKEGKQGQTCLAAIGVGILFVLIIFTKYIFQYILFFFLMPFCVLGVRTLIHYYSKNHSVIARRLPQNILPTKQSQTRRLLRPFGARNDTNNLCHSLLIQKNKKNFTLTGTFLTIVILMTSACVISYKRLNQKYSGIYTFTDRGAWALYGNTARNLQPMNPQRIQAAFASVAGEGVCRSLFPVEECDFWSYRISDWFGYGKLAELQGTVPKDQIDDTLMRMTKELALQNPFQLFWVTGIMSFKMFFWESTKIGFVDYPHWLNRLYDTTIIKNGLRLIVFLLSLVSFWGSAWFLLTRILQWQIPGLKGNKFAGTSQPSLTTRADSPVDAQTPLILFTLVMLTGYILAHSIFFVIPRYALPVAPLFLILITYFAQKIFFPERHHD